MPRPLFVRGGRPMGRPYNVHTGRPMDRPYKMRWIWIDKFVEFTPGVSATAIKAVSLAEEHLHDLYPDFPIVPHSLIIEGMAQTAGILVGEARQFKEKVILAKIGKATFHRLVRPGETISFRATIDQLNE